MLEQYQLFELNEVAKMEGLEILRLIYDSACLYFCIQYTQCAMY